MDFTREPIIETVITPKEGWKLVLRTSKGAGQEEYFVDAVEIVRFGSSQFFRSLERPKCFLLPVSDFEILEVREARMVLKNVGVDRSIKIGGGKEASKKDVDSKEESTNKDKSETRGRRQRRSVRRRRGKDDLPQEGEERKEKPEKQENGEDTPPPVLIAPPSTLISDNLSKYREDEKYKNAFYDPAEAPQEEATAVETVKESPEASLEDFDKGDDILFQSSKEESVEEETVANGETTES